MNRVSVIIPTLNEAPNIGPLLRFIRQQGGRCVHEILVCDAGSTDATVQQANELGATVISCSKGRSIQMNAGAAAATGDILYFLHADSMPPPHFTHDIVHSVSQGFAAGCFRMKFDSQHWLLRCSAWFTRFNNRLCRGGDQSMFIRNDVYKSIGGFDEKFIIFEDNEIINRIRMNGKFTVIQRDLITSARRFNENGIVRLSLIFLWLHTRYRLGTSHDKLLLYYKKHVR